MSGPLLVDIGNFKVPQLGLEKGGPSLYQLRLSYFEGSLHLHRPSTFTFPGQS